MQCLKQQISDRYAVYNGDSCEVIQAVPTDSVHLTVTSIPFASLYTYHDSPRDMGNSAGAGQFFEHLSFLIRELLRVTVPGRLACIHVQDIPAMIVRDGWIGLKDFSGQTVQAFTDAGWIYHGRITNDRNPQAQAIRTKAKGLMFVQLRKDASWMRPALPDYILLFRKPGENPTPIVPDISNNDWIEWAHPVWYTVNESNVLDAVEGRDEKDEKHICPLQLDIIERCIRLWSNAGEVVLDPFNGIGSTGYVAIKHNRKYIGSELKPSYYNATLKNLKRAEAQLSHAQTSLFAMAEPEPEDACQPT